MERSPITTDVDFPARMSNLSGEIQSRGISPIRAFRYPPRFYAFANIPVVIAETDRDLFSLPDITIAGSHTAGHPVGRINATVNTILAPGYFAMTTDKSHLTAGIIPSKTYSTIRLRNCF